MNAHVLLNLLKALRKKDKMQGLSSILLFSRNEFMNDDDDDELELEFYE